MVNSPCLIHVIKRPCANRTRYRLLTVLSAAPIIVKTRLELQWMENSDQWEISYVFCPASMDHRDIFNFRKKEGQNLNKKAYKKSYWLPKKTSKTMKLAKISSPNCKRELVFVETGNCNSFTALWLKGVRLLAFPHVVLHVFIVHNVDMQSTCHASWLSSNFERASLSYSYRSDLQTMKRMKPSFKLFLKALVGVDRVCP